LSFNLPSRNCLHMLALGAALFSAPLAMAQEPTATQLSAARDVVLSSGVTRSFDQIIPNYMAQVTRTLTQTRPELTKQVEDTLKELRPEFEARKAELVNTAAKIYASDMSEAELKDIAAFFNSPAGKKYVNSQPDMLNKLVAVVQAWTRVLSTEMVDRVRAELKKKNIDL